MNNDDHAKQDLAIKELIAVGSEITGSIAGGIIGLLTTGPVGAIFGSASVPFLTRTIKKISHEVQDKFLGHREEVRIGATLTYALDKIKIKIENGENTRDDNFFNSEKNERSAAEEILEGILIASQKEHQEKKLRYYGNLIANLGFDKSFDREQANHLIKISEQLTFRQLCLLELFAHKGKYELRQNDYMDVKIYDSKVMVILQEIYELYNHSMLISDGAMLGFTFVNPSKMKVIGEGAYLHNLMELCTIEIYELMKTSTLLK